MPTNQLPIKGDRNWGTTLNNWLKQLGPESLGGIHNGDTAGRPAGLTVDDEGRVYIDTESKELLNWDGSAWQILLTGNQEQKFSITAKTTDYTITPTEAETGLNGFSNDGATGTVVFTLPDAVAGMKVTIINAGSQTLQVQSVNDDKIYTTDIPIGAVKLENNTNSKSSVFYCVSGTKWIVRDKGGVWAVPPLPARGYLAGGYIAGAQNVIDGIEFSSETAIDPAATLSVKRSDFAGVSSATSGYFSAGSGVFATGNEIDGIKFSDETAINPSATISTQRHASASFNSGLKGFWAGAATVDPLSISSFIFATETAAALSSTIGTNRYHLSGLNSSTDGYFAGGRFNSTHYDAIDNLDFSTETASVISTTLSSVKSRTGSVSSDTKGYIQAGDTGVDVLDTVESFVFSSESISTLASTLSSQTEDCEGLVSATKGYFAESYGYFYTVDFASESISDVSLTSSLNRSRFAGCQSS